MVISGCGERCKGRPRATPSNHRSGIRIRPCSTSPRIAARLGGEVLSGFLVGLEHRVLVGQLLHRTQFDSARRKSSTHFVERVQSRMASAGGRD